MYLGLTPFQKVASAWNLMQDVRGDLAKEPYEKTNIILQVLDEILLDLHPCVTDEPVPLPSSHCWGCCDDSR